MWGTWHIISPMSETVGGTRGVPRVPYLIAPMLKLIMNVTAALLDMLFVIRVKREVIFHGPVDPDLGPSAVVNSRPSRQ